MTKHLPNYSEPATFNDKTLELLRAKINAGVTRAEAAEAKAIPVLRNMSEAKSGLERAMNIF